MVDKRAWSPTPGETVSVSLPGLGFISGKVVWVKEGKAGVSFDELLHETVHERIAQLI